MSLRAVPIISFLTDHFRNQKRTIIKKGEQETKVTVSKFPKRSDIMVKKGPCRHCGTEHTPMWRNGPAWKPVLCNACGTRWRIKHSFSTKHETINEESTISGSGSGSASGTSNEATGLNEPNYKSIPKRKRSSLDQIVLSPMERFHKQLYDIAHEQPEIYFKEPVVGDILIEEAHNSIFAQRETALGAMLLRSPPKEVERTESLSSTNVKATNAYSLFGNGGEW